MERSHSRTARSSPLEAIRRMIALQATISFAMENGTFLNSFKRMADGKTTTFRKRSFVPMFGTVAALFPGRRRPNQYTDHPLQEIGDRFTVPGGRRCARRLSITSSPCSVVPCRYAGMRFIPAAIAPVRIPKKCRSVAKVAFARAVVKGRPINGSPPSKRFCPPPAGNTLPLRCPVPCGQKHKD